MFRPLILVALSWVGFAALLVVRQASRVDTPYTNVADSTLRDARGTNPGHPWLSFTRCACASALPGQEECFCEDKPNGVACIKCTDQSVQNWPNPMIVVPHGYTARFLVQCGRKERRTCLNGFCAGQLTDQGACNNITNYQEESIQ